MLSKNSPAHGLDKDHPLHARHEFLDFWSSHVKRERNADVRSWIMTGVAVFGIAYGAWGQYEAKTIPTRVVVVEIDRETRRVVPKVAEGTVSYQDAIVRSQLASYVENLFTVTVDWTVMRRDILRALAMSGEAAQERLKDALKVNDVEHPDYPRKKAERMLVQVEVLSILKEGEGVYKLEWREVRRQHNGKPIDTQQFKGVAKVAVSEPKSATDLGVFVTAFDFQPVAAPPGASSALPSQ